MKSNIELWSEIETLSREIRKFSKNGNHEKEQEARQEHKKKLAQFMKQCKK
jgi:predicted RNA-binding protein with PIN domain